MLLPITYSYTKRLLKKTIKSFKSYFSGGYERLPKTAPCNPFSCTNTSHFNHSYREPKAIIGCLRESIKVLESKESNKNEPLKYEVVLATIKSVKLKESNMIIKGYDLDNKKKETKKLNHGKLDDEDESSKCLVTRKLKELEMMDQTDFDLVLDVEEVLHYYSRLTCPIYRGIVEKILMEMYSAHSI